VRREGHRRWLLTVALVGAVAAALVANSSGAAGGHVSRTASKVRVLDVLRGNGIGRVRFGASPRAVREDLDSVLRQRGSAYRRGGSCDLDHQMTWRDDWTASGQPALTVYFRHSAFVGYQFGDPNPPPRHPAVAWTLATTRGLQLNDHLARGRRLYGRRFSLSEAQGGSWNLVTPAGRLEGYAWGMPRHGDVSWRSTVLTLDAGDVGCAALTP
jgi:hypothetical protein